LFDELGKGYIKEILILARFGPQQATQVLAPLHILHLYTVAQCLDNCEVLRHAHRDPVPA